MSLRHRLVVCGAFLTLPCLPTFATAQCCCPTTGAPMRNPGPSGMTNLVKQQQTLLRQQRMMTLQKQQLVQQTLMSRRQQARQSQPQFRPQQPQVAQPQVAQPQPQVAQPHSQFGQPRQPTHQHPSQQPRQPSQVKRQTAAELTAQQQVWLQWASTRLLQQSLTHPNGSVREIATQALAQRKRN